MSATFAEALAAVEPTGMLEPVNSCSRRTWPDPVESPCFGSLDRRELARLTTTVRRRFPSIARPDVEDAVQEALLVLLAQERRGRPDWEADNIGGLIVHNACWQVLGMLERGKRDRETVQAVKVAAAPVTRKVWTRQRIEEALWRFHREFGRSPRQAELGCADKPEWMPSAAVVSGAYGGSWNAALEAAGLPTDIRRGNKPTWTTTAIIDGLRALADQLGRCPVLNDVERSKPGWAPSGYAVKSHFGTWTAALDAAGLRVGSGTRELSLAA